MKNIIAILFSFFIIGTISTHAQERPPEPPKPNFKPMNPMDKLSPQQRYKVLRGAGVGVIGAGTAMLTVSLNSIQKANQFRKENPQVRGDGLVDLMRAFGVFVGGVWIAGGTTMTVIANHKLDRLKRFSVTSDGNSVGLVYKF